MVKATQIGNELQLEERSQKAMRCITYETPRFDGHQWTKKVGHIGPTFFFVGKKTQNFEDPLMG